MIITKQFYRNAGPYCITGVTKVWPLWQILEAQLSFLSQIYVREVHTLNLQQLCNALSKKVNKYVCDPKNNILGLAIPAL